MSWYLAKVTVAIPALPWVYRPGTEVGVSVRGEFVRVYNPDFTPRMLSLDEARAALQTMRDGNGRLVLHPQTAQLDNAWSCWFSGGKTGPL